MTRTSGLERWSPLEDLASRETSAPEDAGATEALEPDVDEEIWASLAARGWLSAKPLLERVNKLGGLRACGIRREEGAEAERLAKAFYRAKSSGRLRVYVADRLACKVARCHPQGLWGDLWWAAADATSSEDAPAAATRRALRPPHTSERRPGPIRSDAAQSLRWVEVAALALAEIGGALTAREILDWNDTCGPHRPHGGKTPVRTINRDLHAAIRRGEQGLGHGEGPGTFVLLGPRATPAASEYGRFEVLESV